MTVAMTIQQAGMFTAFIAGTFLSEDAESGSAWTAVCKCEYRIVRVKLIKRWDMLQYGMSPREPGYLLHPYPGF